jgi:hypothetical protein
VVPLFSLAAPVQIDRRQHYQERRHSYPNKLLDLGDVVGDWGRMVVIKVAIELCRLIVKPE